MATLASLRVRNFRTFYCKSSIRKNHTGETAQMSKSVGGYLSLGVVSGGLGSLMGLGGAFIALPVMTGYFLVPQNIAHGTSIAVVLATSLGACYSYSNRDAAKEDTVALPTKAGKTFLGIPEVIGSVNMVNAAALALTSSVTVVFGAMLSKRLHGVHLKLIHGSMMLICAPLIAFKEHFKGTPTVSVSKVDAPESPLEFTSLPLSEQFDKLVRPMSIGVLTGTLAGLLGVGGGLIMVPALNFFTDMDYQTSLGTSLAAIVPTAIVGTVTQLKQGLMNTRIAAPLAIGCIAGSYVGGKLGKDIGDENLQLGFGAFMVGIGAKTVHTAVKLMRKI